MGNNKTIMNRRISIRKPCHISWKDLDTIQSSKNKHCRECSIDIIDFTQMSSDEIVKYLSERKTEKVCARMYSVDKSSRYSKVQELILSWREYIKSNVNNRRFKTAILALLGSMLFTTGCMGEPSDDDPCRVEFVPDTTTTDPNDSTYVEVCD